MRVLIVDDSEALVQRLASNLTAVAGTEIVGYAANVNDAVQRIPKTKPDVVILDIHMPDGSGIAVLESLKRNQFRPIVIMLSDLAAIPSYAGSACKAGLAFFRQVC